MNFVYARPFLTNALQQMGASTPAATPLSGCKCKLFKSGLAPNPDTPLASFEEADFDGYAAVDSITFNAPSREGAYTEQMVAAKTCAYTATGNTTPNSIGGYYLTSGDDSVLIGSREFDAPVPVGNVGDNITVVPAVPMQLTQAGEDAVINT